MRPNLLLVLAGLAIASGLAATPAETAPRWRIALSSNREGDSEIYSMNADGSGVRRLTHSPKYDGAGPWSPDGRKLLFYSQRSPGGDVWVMNADGSDPRNLSRNQAHDGGGSWSPSGRQVVFDSNRDGNGELYVMNADGSGQRMIGSHPPSEEMAPSWSPDGSTILFVTDRDGNEEIYAMDADGSDPRNLTRSLANEGGVDSAPGALWSPDGRRIAFVSTRDTDNDNPEIYVMDADGSGLRRLTHAAGIEYLLSWSPDGRKLAFQRERSKPRWAFSVMNANGGGVTQVSWSLPRKS